MKASIGSLLSAVLLGNLITGMTPASAQTPTVYKGMLTFTLWINTATAVPSGGELICSATAIVADVVTSPTPSTTAHSETASIPATISSPSSAYCVVSIPYQWTLLNGGSDSVTLSYSATMVSGSGASSRATSAQIGSISVPTGSGTTALGPYSVRL